MMLMLSLGILFLGAAVAFVGASAIALIGLLLVCAAYVTARTAYRPLAGFAYFVGSAMFIVGVVAVNDLPYRPMLDPLVLGACCFVVVLGLRERSTALKTVGLTALLSYLAYLS